MVILLVAVVLLVVALLVAPRSGAGLKVNWGLIQTILVILILILVAIWLFQLVQS